MNVSSATEATLGLHCICDTVIDWSPTEVNEDDPILHPNQQILGSNQFFKLVHCATVIQGFTHVTPLKTALVTMNFLIFAQHISTINKNFNQPEPRLPRGPCMEICIPGPYQRDQVSISLILCYRWSDQSLLPARFCPWHTFVSSPC